MGGAIRPWIGSGPNSLRIPAGIARCWLLGGPSAKEQHLIIWLDLAERVDQRILGDQTAKIVGGILPGVSLGRVELQPP